jgi:hypothetical protein
VSWCHLLLFSWRANGRYPAPLRQVALRLLPLREQPLHVGGPEWISLLHRLPCTAGRSLDSCTGTWLRVGFLCWADYTKLSALPFHYFPLNSSAVACPGWLMPSRVSTLPIVPNMIFTSNQKLW